MPIAPLYHVQAVATSSSYLPYGNVVGVRIDIKLFLLKAKNNRCVSLKVLHVSIGASDPGLSPLMSASSRKFDKVYVI